MRKLTPKKVLLPLALLFALYFLSKRCSFHPLPKERISALKVDFEESYEDHYQLTIGNPGACPMRFFLTCEDEEVNELLKAYSPLLLGAKADTTILIEDKGDLSGKVKLKVKWGDPELPIRTDKIAGLPYPKGKRYKLLQGNNSNPTHNHAGSRYAFDFTMRIGDTITSTQDGFVVVAIDGYRGWGMSDRWKPFGNQVMVYDTASHLFTMYGHLKEDGSLVEVGDFVRVGQPIALSGKTGQTTEEHLHFNVLRADSGKSGLISHPVDSIGGYRVKELKRYQWMEN